MGVRPQKMRQTLNSLLLSTKSMIAMATNGNQGQTLIGPLKLSTNHKWYKSSKYASNFSFPITTH